MSQRWREQFIATMSRFADIDTGGPHVAATRGTRAPLLLGRWYDRCAAALAACLLIACSPPAVDAPRPLATAAAEQGGVTRAAVYASVRKQAAVGERLFSDPSLSGSGKLACASCHSPAHAFGPPNALPVQLGGRDLHQPGYRAVPSLMYLQSVPAFTEHYHDSDDEGDESVDAGPTGGLTWDGRVDARGAQAAIPLLSSFEMDSTPARVAAAVRAAPYADAFHAAFGARKLDDDQAVFDAVLEALAAFQEEPARFSPYTSKYDAYLAGRASLTAAELRGLRLFEDERKGNCASCHPSARAKDGSPPLLTDFGLIALGVPRNRVLAANRDPRFFDLGACGPWRTDLAGRDTFCGLFRTPTLRNVATRHAFFHNGIYRSLEDVLRFYVERDIHPERFYRVAAGRARKFDDLPARYRDNVNTEPPFDRGPGDKPALNEAEIRDVIAFLQTLTDGYESHK
ncbi:cytochrome-c peroxidase [Trinickia sp. LjRoot230]|uniref:cytochrome-c peroxidase n=1 Tax=Trinickia sp. LjRoot230 TaxID=3342288 RepID=UPI003F4F6703